MTGKIVEKREVAISTLRVTFEPSEPISFKPGQYIFITLPNGLKKHFSIVSSPNQKNITITTRISDSDYKQTLNNLEIGTEVTLGPVAGIFHLPAPIKSGLEPTKPIVFIAGGIGITPFMSMLQYIKEENLPHKVTLIYSNRNQASTAYLTELQTMSTELPTLNLILTMTEDPEWGGEKRKIDVEFIKGYLPNPNDNLFLVAGPPGMVDAVRSVLKEAGVIGENIEFENFTGY